MKKKFAKVLCLGMSMMLLMMMLPGCGSDDGASDADSATVAEEQSTDAQSSADQSSDTQSTDGQQLGTDPNTGQPIEAVDISALGGNGADVDVSKLSSTMVYSVVYDMTTRPKEYIGKKVRISGSMATYHDEETDMTYYACLIADATACCSQGIEFQTTDEFDPADYPAEGEPVTVMGTYDTYEENGYQYCVLKEAVLE